MAITYSSPVITITTLSSGTATSGGASTLTDSGKSWTTNEHAKRGVAIVSGTGAGQLREIASNTATALTVSLAWTTQPDNTSVYRILYNANDIYAAGYATRVGTGKYYYDFNTNRISITSGGIYFSETYPSTFGQWAGTNRCISVASGGIVGVGTSLSRGRPVDFGRTLTGTTGNENNSTDFAAIYLASGGYFFWEGGEIQCHFPFYFDPGSIIRIRDKSCFLTNEGAQVNAASSAPPQFKYEATNMEIYGLTTFCYNVAPKANPTLFAGWTTAYLPTGAAIGPGTDPANTFLVFSGVDFTDRIAVVCRLYYSKWFRFVNIAFTQPMTINSYSATGSLNKGIVEIRQGIQFALTNGSGAKVYSKDIDHGVRLAVNQIGTNPDYTADRTYTLTESAGSASYTTDGGVLVGVFYNKDGGTAEVNDKFDSRCIANDQSFVLSWLKVEYGQQPATRTITMKGTSDISAEIQSLPDTGITTASKSTVAAYTGISFNYAAGTLTCTVSSSHTWDQIYDYLKYWESENPATIWENGSASFVSTSSKLSYTYVNFALVITGATTVVQCAEGQALPTRPTVTSGAFFEDALGVIWEAGSNLYYARHVFLQITALTGGANIQGAVCCCYDTSATPVNRTYTTARTLGALESNASGAVEGYYVYRINSTTYTLNEYILAYGFLPYVVPVSSTGLALSEVLKLVTDTQVVLSKSAALAISGITIVPNVSVDLSDETFADSTDNLKARQAQTAAIYGITPGYESYVLYGSFLSRTDTLYTGKVGWLYLNSVPGGTWKTGTLNFASPGPYEYSFDTCTLRFATVGTYTLSDSIFAPAATISLVNSSGGAVIVQLPLGVSYINIGPNITVQEPQVYQSVTISGGMAGTRIQLYDQAEVVELYNNVPSSWPFVWTDSVPYAADREIRLRAAYATDTAAALFVDAEIGTCTELSPAITYLLAQEADTVYELNGVAGDEVTGVSIVDATFRMNVATGAISWAALYAYQVYWLTTEEGIRDEGSFIVAKDTANYIFYEFKIKNVTSPTVPLVISQGYGIDADTQTAQSLFDTSGGSIFAAPDRVVPYMIGAEASVALVQAGMTAQGYTPAKADDIVAAKIAAQAAFAVSA